MGEPTVLESHRPAAPIVASTLLALATACGAEPREETPEGPPRTLESLANPARHEATAPDTFRARFETTEGTFVVDVRRDWAPRGADRFYNLVRGGYYDSVYVHRVVPGTVAQFGIHYDPRISYVWSQHPIRDDPRRMSNRRGRLSFARHGPDSRTTQVFVNLSDNPGLDDQGFQPFGEVVEGMDVVDGFYDGYGDGPPRGEGPYPAQARAEGNAYFEESFPELDRIEEARITGEAGEG